jgi:hypothetical protein
MRHYDATSGGGWTEDVRQNACYVLIGKTVKSVPPDTLGGEPAR